MNPNAKVAIYHIGVGSYEAREIYKEVNLGHLPCHNLFDVARNESAPMEWRKAAVELLLDKHCSQVSHPELRELVTEVRTACASDNSTRVEAELDSPSH